MNIGDIRPVPSTTRVSDRSADNGNSRRPPHKPRSAFGFPSVQEDSATYQLLDQETNAILTQVPLEGVMQVAHCLQELLRDRKAK